MSHRKDDRPTEYKPPTIEEVAAQEGTFLRRSLFRLGFRGVEIDDVAQEVLQGVHKALATFDPQKSVEPTKAIRGLIFTIAKAQAARSRQRIVEQHEIPMDSSELDQLQGSGVVPEEDYSLSERRSFLVELLRRIPPERRAVVQMYDIEQTPMVEIAESLGIPENTAWDRRRRGLLDLRAEWIRLKTRWK